MAALLATGWDAVNRFRKIEEATAPRDDPAPVYLLDEIADMARQSPEAATAIAEAVQKKLAAKNPVVKFKALRIIKHLSTKGCSHFQRCMQRHSSSVRELIHWRGEPDPFKGDVPNARVREFAKEVVEVMFNSGPVQPSNNTLAAQGKIQGFGSENSSGHYSGGFNNSGGSSGQYGGIGSSGSGSTSGGHRPSGGMGSSIPTSFADAQRAASQFSQVAQQALGEGPLGRGLSDVLGGFMQPAGYSNRLNESGYRDASPEPSFNSGAAYAAPAVSHVTANQVLGSESALVDDITTPGGVRALPDPADLRRFVDTASNMDGLRIAELLREKMESPRWQVVLRSLAALEAVLQRGSSQACGEVAVMFQSDPTPVRNALSSPQAQVQQLAAAALIILTGEEVQVSAAPAAGKKSSTAAAAAAKAPMMDLLIDDTPSSSEPAAAPAAPASGIDLLGDLAGPAPAAPAAAAGGDLFDGLGVHAAAPAAAGASSNGDMFGGLTVDPPAAAAAAAVAALAPAPAAAAPAAAVSGGNKSAPLDDLFAGLSTGPAANSSSSSLIGGLPSPQPMHHHHQQQQQLGAMGAAAQQQHPVQQQDWLGGDLGVPGPKMQQPGPGFGMQANGLRQQQQMGVAGFAGSGMGQWPMGQIPAAHPGPGGMGAPVGQMHSVGQVPAAGGIGSGTGGLGSLGGAQHVGLGSLSGSSTSGSGLIKGGSLQGVSGGGANSGNGAWSGHDDVSNLMRQVAHGGKYDPAFDFVADEFKVNKR